ncbi:putative FAD-binding domain containing protein [Lyophyllum shimeji]|uniref:FAD-binding domain containing protein n=1 Tax=Lyophyllum shimeji TaxID=47721 RepID=A0A9P3UX19_LYOSH|nr:putative FAD-binding domain containing protein [Lyophyllum shimeji]
MADPDTGTPPVIPPELQQYNSYIEDPKWQVKFTIAWTSVLALFVVLALPAAVRGRRKWAAQIFGVSEDWRGRYARLGDQDAEPEKKSCCGVSERSSVPGPSRRKRRVVVARRILLAIGSVFYWTPPGIGLNAGQILLIAAYASAVLACMCVSAPLASNSNRAGFLALAQLPQLFLLSSKNTLLSLLLSPSSFAYTRLNPLHRWAGRTMALAALVHGALWIRNHVQWGMPILGQQKETSGVAALGVLGVVVISSLRPVRVAAWGVFYWVHYLAVPAFFITVCYHTMYAAPWIFPPIAIYAFDVFMRAARFRLKDAQLIRVDNQMTLIHIPDCDAGFRAGQHLRVRVFFEGRAFEAHPLSVMCASASETTCVRTKDVVAYCGEAEAEVEVEAERAGGEMASTAPGILLGARAVGDWTRALNEYARRREEEALGGAADDDGGTDDQERVEAKRAGPSSSAASSSSSASSIVPTKTRVPVPVPVQVQVMFDGPYGGCSVDLERYDRVLLVAGGSGATFAVGLMDGLVAAARAPDEKANKSVKTTRVHFVWCTRSFGSIKWFAPLLRAIALAAAAPTARISLRMTVYVTCMCSPEEVGVPGLEVRVGGRPDMGRLVGALAGLCPDDDAGGKGAGMGMGSGEEVCACGCVEETVAREEEEQKGDVDADADVDVEKQARVAQDGVEERFEGSLAVCASGPESLTREAANAVARCMARGREVGLHTEVFAV